MNNTFCLDCKDRCLGCHSNCGKYKEYKEKLEIIRINKSLQSIFARRRVVRR